MDEEFVIGATDADCNDAAVMVVVGIAGAASVTVYYVAPFERLALLADEGGLSLLPWEIVVRNISANQLVVRDMPEYRDKVEEDHTNPKWLHVN